MKGMSRICESRRYQKDAFDSPPHALDSLLCVPLGEASVQSCQIRTGRRHSLKYLKACDNPGSTHVLHIYTNRYTSIYKLKIGDTNQNSLIHQHWVDLIDFYHPPPPPGPPAHVIFRLWILLLLPRI